MKTVVFSIFYLYITLFPHCNASPAPILENDGMVGNALAVTGTNPYQVAILQRLRTRFDIIDSKKFICGGSLIDNQWVLTAAQCVTNPTLRVQLGVNNIRVYEKHIVGFDVNEKNIVVHPLYNASDLEYDIALIKLPKPIEYNEHIQPVSLDSNKGDHVDETVFLAGWGRISPFTPIADHLRQTTLKILPNEECQKSFIRPFAYIRCSHLCTASGLLFSEIGACAGDTGAPLIAFNSETSRPEQIGLVSKPTFRCKGTEPTIYTKVSAYENWIADTIRLPD